MHTEASRQTTNANTRPGTVYLVDDDASVLKMLQALVETLGVDVHAFARAKDFLQAYRKLPRECLVCDVRMPDMDGVQLQQQLKARGAAIPIIFLTGFAEVSVAVEAMRQGAFDFLEKPFSARSLLDKISGGLELSQAQHASWLAQQTREARLALLTPKERTIIAHVLQAQSSREIAELMNLSARTVENHRTRIMEKLHVASIVDLVKLFQ
jgi:FixJ family two-component response regulator